MKKKIYSAIVTSATVSALFAFVPLFIATQLGLDPAPKILVTVLGGIFAVISAIFLAKLFSSKILLPLEKLDPNRPQTDKSYDEIDSLISRIRRQEKLIDRQLEDMRRRQLEFKAITENMSEGIVILDDKSEILSYNSAALRILGADKVKEGEHFISLSRSRRFVAAVSEAFEGGHGESRLNIGERVFEIFVNPVTMNEAVCGVVILLLDITEQEKREEMRREFSSNVSHELKTPLTTISGISEMLMGGIIVPDDIPRFAKNIYDEAHRLLVLINDIIKLSRLDDTTDPELPDKLELLALSKEVCDRLLISAADRDITLEVEGEETEIEGNRSILTEMIYNLTDNAIKYNNEGGKVTISIENRDNAPALTVKDTGIGIPDEHIARIFERFYRVDKSHSREIGGTGLGLSIVKHAAEYHKASLSVKSKVGEGTEITVKFSEK